MNRIVVLGGSGFIGRHLCEKWVASWPEGSATVVVPTRRPAHVRDLLPLPGIEPALLERLDEKRLAPLLHGADAVVNLVGILHGSEAAFRQAHAGLPEQLVRACRQAGVRRVVHVSALGASADAPSHYLRSKAAGEAALRAATDLQLTLLRPSVVFGEGDRFLTLFARLQRSFPVLPLAGGESRLQPVWVEDVARAILRCLDRPDSIGQVYECAGPRVYTLRELVHCAGVWSGHSRPVLPLPPVLGRLQALLLEALPGEPLMTRDNLASLQVDNVASGRCPGLRELHITPAALEAIAPGYLAEPGLTDRLYGLRATARRG
ncbi:complex I NDUFA9 subunit family protein [Eleftheria terrae]|uniref:complex I NDUFA9 subunit family protein n=1 Tax=Eleftheria terrae TaxID=1597781 RepID=UPI00263BCF54|nr:complex I NDUFA9 subunit family protein [Eleftheria terrae]WKB50661.1 complex I NDUFA9 subunit family protein [Eleftheria terrae]